MYLSVTKQKHNSIQIQLLGKEVMKGSNYENESTAEMLARNLVLVAQ